MKRCIFILVFLISSSALGTDYYFSDCTTVNGGSGTDTDPWCIDPPDTVACAASGDVWAAAMSDGCGTEFTAGDKAILCCGGATGCTAAGQTCTVGVVNTTTDDTGDRVWLVPRMSGTAANRIRVEPFCSGGTCDSVTISGDHDGDNLVDTNEPEHLISGHIAAHATRQYWTFDGNPLVSSGDWTQAKFLHLTKSNGRMVVNDACGANNCSWGFFVFEDMKFSRTNPATWTVTHYQQATACLGFATTHYMFKINNASGDLTFDRNQYELACSTAFRLNNMGGTGYTITINDSEFFNMEGGLDLNSFSVGSTFTWNVLRNYSHDVLQWGSFEKNMRNVTAADNIVTCEGVHQVSASWKCEIAIRVGDDFCPRPGEPDRSTQLENVTIARNKIYGLGESGGANGWFNSGMQICGTMVDAGDPNIVVENNMIWHIKGGSGGVDCPGDQGSNAALFIDTDDHVTVQNNTIFDTKFGIAVAKGNPTVRNNITARADQDASEFLECNNAAGSYTFNNIHDSAGNVACENSSAAGLCNGTTYTCAGIGSFGSNNKCTAPVFVKCDSATWCVDSSATSKADWDLHLHSTDTENRDAGTAGPSDDIDLQVRPQGPATDIGADEFFLGAGNPTIGVFVGGKTRLDGKTRLSVP